MRHLIPAFFLIASWLGVIALGNDSPTAIPTTRPAHIDRAMPVDGDPVLQDLIDQIDAPLPPDGEATASQQRILRAQTKLRGKILRFSGKLEDLIPARRVDPDAAPDWSAAVLTTTLKPSQALAAAWHRAEPQAGASPARRPSTPSHEFLDPPAPNAAPEVTIVVLGPTASLAGLQSGNAWYLEATVERVEPHVESWAEPGSSVRWNFVDQLSIVARLGKTSPVTSPTSQTARARPQNVVILIDGTGSMLNVMPVAKTVARQIINSLGPDQFFAVCVSRRDRLIGQPVFLTATKAHETNVEKLLGAIMTTDRGGLSKPVAELLQYRPDVICLLSDGDFPDDAELSQVIKASRVPINTFLNLPYRWSRRDDRERLTTVAKQSGGTAYENGPEGK